jgi:hypothetical protein
MSWFSRLSLVIIILIIVGAMIHACCQRAPSTARWRLPFCGEKETPEPAPPATNILPSVKSLMLK